MSDRVVVMNQGAIEQTGTPSDVYEAPANRFVLDFVGFSNFLRADSVDDAGKRPPDCGHRMPAGFARDRGQGVDARGELAIRPERIRIASGGSAPTTSIALAGRIRDMAFEGALLDVRRLRSPTGNGSSCANRMPGAPRGDITSTNR